MTEIEHTQNGVQGQHSNDQLKKPVKRDSSESSSALSTLDSSIYLSSESQAKDPLAFDPMHRFGHLAQLTNNAPYQSPYSLQPPPKKPPPAEKEVTMSYEGVDLTAEGNQGPAAFSWHDPHPLFVILLVGPEEIPYGIQKDLLCAHSPYYAQEFAQAQNKLENIVKIPDTDVTAFGCFQNFIFTGEVYNKRVRKLAPDYSILMGVWKLATQLRMPSLRAAVLDAMAERRHQTGFIPNSELLVEAWRQTEDGSGLRKMLIEWAAQHMRSHPQERTAFIRTLPNDILSALVIVLSDMPVNFANPANTSPLEVRQSVKHPISENMEEPESQQNQSKQKRARKSAVGLVNAAPDEAFEVKPNIKKPARKSEPARRANRRVSAPASGPSNGDDESTFTPEKEMEYCRELIKRMNSGPGYWTRYVPNFKKPVDPVADNAPNYFDVVKKPMCLSLMKTKMENGDYANAEDFESDVRLIFQNCYEYWTPTDPIWKECQIFEDFFNAQWAQRSKYAAGKKYASSAVKSEVID